MVLNFSNIHFSLGARSHMQQSSVPVAAPGPASSAAAPGPASSISASTSNELAGFQVFNPMPWLRSLFSHA